MQTHAFEPPLSFFFNKTRCGKNQPVSPRDSLLGVMNKDSSHALTCLRMIDTLIKNPKRFTRSARIHSLIIPSGSPFCTHLILQHPCSSWSRGCNAGMSLVLCTLRRQCLEWQAALLDLQAGRSELRDASVDGF